MNYRSLAPNDSVLGDNFLSKIDSYYKYHANIKGVDLLTCKYEQPKMDLSRPHFSMYQRVEATQVFTMNAWYCKSLKGCLRNFSSECVCKCL